MDERLPASNAPSKTGALIVNADDWGRDRETSGRTLECFLRGSISAVSAMVFMEDSERAAEAARMHGIDAGLHLNFTTPFSRSTASDPLLEHQERLTRFLRGSRYAQVLFSPSLAKSFGYVVRAQIDEFERLYGHGPRRIDGHHHMHLCANVVLAKLLPAGTIVRRNFTFFAGEKGRVNRLYRRSVDAILGRRHRLTDCLFTLPPLHPASRLDRIFSIARSRIVELEVHPIVPEEYLFLAGGEIFGRIGGLTITKGFDFGSPALSAALS